MQEKGLTPHKAEDRTKNIKADYKIADNFHNQGGRLGKPPIGEPLNQLHS